MSVEYCMYGPRQKGVFLDKQEVFYYYQAIRALYTKCYDKV